MPNIAYRGLGQADLTQALEKQYVDLRTWCIEKHGENFCNSVLPRNLFYAITREDLRPAIPWWGWMLLGAFVGRLLR